MRQLRWRLNIGMHPPEPGGQWTASEATFVVAAAAPRVTVRWHAGDEKAPGYRAEVSFYVDGILVERSLAGAGRIRESVLPLPPVAGFKRVSVRILAAVRPGRRARRGRPADARGEPAIISRVAPTTCPPPDSATGVQPAKHRIFDFLERDERTCLPVLSSTRIGCASGASGACGRR